MNYAIGGVIVALAGYLLGALTRPQALDVVGNVLIVVGVLVLLYGLYVLFTGRRGPGARA